jgi:hypothetical protein
MLVPAIETAGAIGVALRAIGFCLMLLFGLRRDTEADREVSKLLIREIVGDEPKVLTVSQQPAIQQDQEPEPITN